MGDKWREALLNDVIEVNPQRIIKRGTIATKVAMENVVEQQRKLNFFSRAMFSGSGAKFKNSDTLLARITPSLENGKTAYVDVLPDGEIGFGSTEFIVLSAKVGISDPLFVYYLARTPAFRQYAIKRMTGSSGRQRVPSDSLLKFPIFLPPLPEQRAIAHILGTLDDKIELNRCMNATLEAIARAIFKSWFVDFDPVRAKMDNRDTGLPLEIAALFPDGFEESELGKIPKGWEVRPVGEIVKVVGGGTPSTKNLSYWEDGTHFFATPKDLSKLSNPILLGTERKVTDAGLEKISSGLLLPGTLLLSSRAPVGYLAISQVPICINQGFIAMICNGPLSNYYMLNWTYENMSTIKGRASGTTFAEISKRNFRPILALVPARKAIRAFNDKVEPIYEKIKQNIEQSHILTEIRDTLLPKLMRGEVRVQGCLNE